MVGAVAGAMAGVKVPGTAEGEGGAANQVIMALA